MGLPSAKRDQYLVQEFVRLAIPSTRIYLAIPAALSHLGGRVMLSEIASSWRYSSRAGQIFLPMALFLAPLELGTDQ